MCIRDRKSAVLSGPLFILVSVSSIIDILLVIRSPSSTYIGFWFRQKSDLEKKWRGTKCAVEPLCEEDETLFEDTLDIFVFVQTSEEGPGSEIENHKYMQTQYMQTMRSSFSVKMGRHLRNSLS